MHWELKNEYKIVVGKPERKRSLGKRERRWEDNFQMELLSKKALWC
jgi:hypothetical protein